MNAHNSLNNKILKAFSGKIIWDYMKVRYCITKTTVVIIAPENNQSWNRAVAGNLKSFMERKSVKKALIFYNNYWPMEMDSDNACASDHYIKKYKMKKATMDRLMNYYLLYRFCDNIVFTYLDWPKDNLAGRIIRETEITEDELVYYGLYHLR